MLMYVYVCCYTPASFVTFKPQQCALTFISKTHAPINRMTVNIIQYIQDVIATIPTMYQNSLLAVSDHKQFFDMFTITMKSDPDTCLQNRVKESNAY